MAEILNHNLFFKNLVLIQSSDMFSFSVETILLSGFVHLKKHDKVLDVGTNNAIIPLILSQNHQNQIEGVEINKKAFEIAFQNIKINNKQNQIKIFNCDFLEFKPSCKYHIIICNPPFFGVNEKRFYKSNSVLAKRNARHEYLLSFSDLVKNVRKMIENKGFFFFVHRVERLQEILEILKLNDFSPYELVFIHSYIHKPSRTFLMACRFKSSCHLNVKAPIFVHQKGGRFTKEVLKFYGKVE